MYGGDQHAGTNRGRSSSWSAHGRYDRKVRYALIVSIRAVNSTTDIYAPVSIKIETSGGIMAWGRVGRRTPPAP